MVSKKEEFLKKLKKGKGYLVTGILIIVITVLFILIYYMGVLDDKKNVLALPEVTETYKYASVDVSIMTDYFATNDYSGVEHKTYFVFDKERMYIVDINDDYREQLNAVFDYSYDEDENATPAEAVTLKGITKTIPDDLKKIAIDSYNDIFKPETKLTELNFDKYFKGIYLDTYEDPTSDMAGLFIVAGMMVFIGGVFVFTYVKMQKTTKKAIASLEGKWDSLLNELDSDQTLYYKAAKLYLTKNYLVSYQNGLEIFHYNDIVWIYPHDYRYNGVLAQKSIYAVTKNAKASRIAIVSANKKNKKLFEELYSTIENHIPNVLSGYTKENQAKARELFQK